MIFVYVSFCAFIASLFFDSSGFLSLLLLFLFISMLCWVYWQARVSGRINNTYADLICRISLIPFLYIVFLLFFELTAPGLYFDFSFFVSGLSKVAGYMVPSIEKTAEGLYALDRTVRAIDVIGKYSVVYILGLIGASLCVVHGAFRSEKELEWVNSQPAEAFSPDLRYVMYFGCFMMIVCVLVLSSVDTSDICERGKCWTTRHSDFPVFYLLPQLEILVGLLVGATIRRAINWKHKQGEMDVRV